MSGYGSHAVHGAHGIEMNVVYAVLVELLALLGGPLNAQLTSVGIGLALSKSIIEKCGGYISVQSTEGKGSKFTIKFFKTI